MKKLLLLTGLLIMLCNCSNNLEFNDRAFQGIKDNELWRASEFSAQIDDKGGLKIVGIFNDESITLNITSPITGVYELGIDSENRISYKPSGSSEFSTLNGGSGIVTINAYNMEAQTISGSFSFNAFSANGDMTNMIDGVIYQVPLITEEVIEKDNKLRASVDDSELIAEDVILLNDNNIIEVQGTGADGRFIKMYLPETIANGSYNLNEQSDSGTYAIYGFNNGETSTAQYGTLFINKHDTSLNMMAGTFSFTTLLPNSVSVEDGSFKIYY